MWAAKDRLSDARWRVSRALDVFLPCAPAHRDARLRCDLMREPLGSNAESTATKRADAASHSEGDWHSRNEEELEGTGIR